MKSAKYLALDVGERIIGVAIGELPSGLIFPRPAIDLKKVKTTDSLEALIEQEKIEALIIGLPLNSDGSKSLQCAKIEKFVKNLKLPHYVAVIYTNEYASTLEAQNRFSAFGIRQVERGKI